MKELNISEIECVNGGLAFIPVLIVSVVSAFGAGYGAGKYISAQKQDVTSSGCEPTC